MLIPLLHLGHLGATYSNSHINSYTDGSDCHARCRPAHQEQFGIEYLAHGYFDMQTRGVEPATFRLQDAGSTCCATATTTCDGLAPATSINMFTFLHVRIQSL